MDTEWRKSGLDEIANAAGVRKKNRHSFDSRGLSFMCSGLFFFPHTSRTEFIHRSIDVGRQSVSVRTGPLLLSKRRTRAVQKKKKKVIHARHSSSYYSFFGPQILSALNGKGSASVIHKSFTLALFAFLVSSLVMALTSCVEIAPLILP